MIVVVIAVVIIRGILADCPGSSTSQVRLVGDGGLCAVPPPWELPWPCEYYGGLVSALVVIHDSHFFFNEQCSECRRAAGPRLLLLGPLLCLVFKGRKSGAEETGSK